VLQSNIIYDICCFSSAMVLNAEFTRWCRGEISPSWAWQ